MSKIFFFLKTMCNIFFKPSLIFKVVNLTKMQQHKTKYLNKKIFISIAIKYNFEYPYHAIIHKSHISSYILMCFAGGVEMSKF